jgi:hypothetical protein
MPLLVLLKLWGLVKSENVGFFVGEWQLKHIKLESFMGLCRSQMCHWDGDAVEEAKDAVTIQAENEDLN